MGTVRTQRRVDAIVIGGSAGALDALSTLLPALPVDCAVPVVVVVHLPPTRPSRLAAVLEMRAAIPVKEAEDKEPVAAGRVYVAPPGYHLLIERAGTFALSLDAHLNFSRPAIDVLFESAAEAYGGALAGVLLTGASEDGARGLAAIAENGGIAVVQSPLSAVARQMPEAAIARVPDARVCALPDIAALIADWARSRNAPGLAEGKS
jgi:two-component system chemotaxis response regulator CheB